MKLLDLTFNAISNYNTFKTCNIDDWITEIDKILHELKQPSIGKDKIENISINNESLEITTSYYVRSCYDSNYLSIPMFIIESEDPIKAAKKHNLFISFNDANEKLNLAKKNLLKAQEEFNSIQTILQGETI